LKSTQISRLQRFFYTKRTRQVAPQNPVNYEIISSVSNLIIMLFCALVPIPKNASQILKYFFNFWSTTFYFSHTILPAIRYIHAQKRGITLLSGLKFHVYIFNPEFFICFVNLNLFQILIL
jgi:hypothetical protein